MTGQVVYRGPQEFVFAGDVLELRLQSDPNVHAFAEIQPDGAFEIDSLVEGEIARGAKPGTYEARIVVSDDDAQHKVQASKAIPKKYLSFETSGLKVEVPSANVKLEISN